MSKPKTVLIVGPTQTLPKRANAIISNDLALEMHERGVQVTYIEANIKADFSSITESKYKYLSLSRNTNRGKSKNIICNIIDKMEYLIHLPNSDYYLADAIKENIKSTMNKEHYDAIIAISNPISSVVAISDFEGSKDSKTIALFLDNIVGGIYNKRISKTYINYKIRKFHEKTISKINQIWLPSNSRKIYETSSYNYLSNRIKYFEFPSYKKNNAAKKNIRKEEDLIFVYAGTLNRDYRNPVPMLETLNQISMTRKIKLYIMGITDNMDILNSYKSTNFFIKHLGLVEQDSVNSYYNNADFIINISNQGIDMVPSKIFELFSTCKPILNFYFDENDVALKYFKRYPLVYNQLNKQLDLEKLEHFLNDSATVIIDPLELNKLYEQNTISYLVDSLFEEI